MLSTTANRQSTKPAATIISVSGHPETLNTQLGLLPSSANVLILPPIKVPSYFTPNSPLPNGSQSGISGSAFNARDLVTTVHTSYVERHAQAEAFTANHPSRGVILQKGWAVLLAECAQQLVDASVCADIEEAIEIIKEICDGGVEEFEEEQDVEYELEESDVELDKTPIIEEETSGDETEVPQAINPRVSQLSNASSTASTTSARPRTRVSERSHSSPSFNDHFIDETEELNLQSTQDSNNELDSGLPLARSHSSQDLRDGQGRASSLTPPSLAGSSAKRNGREGKRFPVKAVSMDNIGATAASQGLGLSVANDKRESTSTACIRDPRDSAFVVDRRKVLDEKLAEDRDNRISFDSIYTDNPGEYAKRKSAYSQSMILNQRNSKDPWGASPISPRISNQSFDSRASTVFDDTFARKRTRKYSEKRKVIAKKTHPSLVFPKEDVMIVLQNSELSPTTSRLLESFASVIVSAPSTPFTPSFSSNTVPYPSPPISPTATPNIYVDQHVPRSSSPTPSMTPSMKFSLFPSRKSQVDSLDERTSDISPTELRNKIAAVTKENTFLAVHRQSNVGSNYVKRVDMTGISPLKIQNEIRTILAENMMGIKKYPTVVQGLALGMGLGLGLLNSNTETSSNNFFGPILGGSGPSSCVDMIFAIGWEKGCEKWGQRLLGRLVAGLGRTGPASCVSLSYLLSSSLHLLPPNSATYTSQVHAALSGKMLVPQIEEYLALNSASKVLIITYDASTIPNANLEPVRELKRIIGGPSIDATLRVLSIVGGEVDGKEDDGTFSTSFKKNTQKRVSRKSSVGTIKSISSGGYRTTPMNNKSALRSASYNSDSTQTRPKTPQGSSADKLPIDQKLLIRRKELSQLSDMLLIEEASDASFNKYIKLICTILRDREELTGSFKESSWEPYSPVREVTSEPEESEPSEEDDEELDAVCSDGVVSVGIYGSGRGHHHGPSVASIGTWSTKMNWGRDLLGKKNRQVSGISQYSAVSHTATINHSHSPLPPAAPRQSGKAYRLLGLEN